MKKIYLTVLLSALFLGLNSQSFQWSKVEGKYAYDYGYGIGTDASGNVYVAGKYEENAIFSGTTLPNQGNHDIYLAQYSPSGSLNWIRTGGAPGGDYAHALYCNKTSNVYIAGEIEGGTCIFPGSSISINAHGDNDVFIAAYDLNGNLQWAKREGHWYNEKALGITGDNSGNLFICGYFRDTTKFGGTNVISKGEEDIFVAKYDASGNFLWMKSAGGPGRDEGKWLVTDATGNVYVCGMYSDGAIFGSTTFTTASTPIGKFFDGYIAKYDPNGNLVWVKNIVGDYDDLAWSITKDNNGKLYITGEFSGAAFGSTQLYSSGYADIFVACYDQNGSVQWAVKGGGTIADRARGIGSDGNLIFVTGQFGNTATFGPHTIASADSSDICVLAVDNTGSFVWAASVGGAADAFDNFTYESGIAICAEPGVAYVTGSLLNGGTFGSTSHMGYTRSDIFITKMSTVAGVNEMAMGEGLSIYPNPGNGIFKISSHHSPKSIKELNVLNYLGETVYKGDASDTEIDLSDKQKGMYFLQITTEENVILKKIILQ
jgi:hypothetical protein